MSLYLLMLAHSQMIVNYTFSIQYKSHNKSKDIPHSWACEKDLPAQGHGHVAAPGVHPGAEARLLEQQRCHQAHHRAHDADDHQHAIGPAASSCSRGFPQEGAKVGQSAQKRWSADRFCCILPVVFKISTKICLFLCIVCEW